MSMMDAGGLTERANLVRRCRHPVVLARTVLHITNAGIAAIVRRLRPTSRRTYPPAARAVLEEGFTERAAPAHMPPEPIGRVTLRLATCDVTFDGAPDWRRNFADPEDAEALHRWNWLLSGLTSQTLDRQTGLLLMRSWVAEAGPVGNGLAWEPYTIGERISNAALFLLITVADGEPPVPADIAEDLWWLAEALTTRLEYFGPQITGNHVVNNARALLYAAHVLGSNRLRRLAHAMLAHDLPRLVTPDGFLREGSSHYQFLFTRWVLEMLWLADRTGAEDVRGLLAPLAPKLLARCRFFLVEDPDAPGLWSIPLIGDVSPDFTPEWLLGVPWSALARTAGGPIMPGPAPVLGWAALFPAEGGSARTTRANAELFADSHWCRMDAGDWTVFVHHSPSPAEVRATHAHADAAGLVVFWRGRVVLADPGRPSYSAIDPLGVWARGPHAHSTVLVDSLSCEAPFHTDRIPGFYRAAAARMTLSQEDATTVLTLDHEGLGRLAGDTVTLRRRIGVSGEGVWIEDHLTGSQVHDVETLFHFAPGLEITETPSPAAVTAGGFVVRRESKAPDHGELRVLRGSLEPEVGGWYFRAYGQRQVAATVIFTERAALPIVRRTVLERGV